MLLSLCCLLVQLLFSEHIQSMAASQALAVPEVPFLCC